MPTRTARTGWTGTLEQGVGQVELSSSKLGTYEVSFPRRAADNADGYTSPEELIAAAHSACYAMQLSALIGQARGEVEGLSADQFAEAAQQAKAGCPVSKALTGVDITLDAALES
jgi:osmotically inducible protein OsmC